MKSSFVKSLIDLYQRKPFIFLTGDLGFNMLEPLRDVMGDRFINCGIAEQNMVGMAAGMARCGESVWVYSIAPFIYARAFEQIRNDVCFHNLPVKLVGMGGGYHYGNMGPSHWALEDYGTLLTLPNMKCFIPAFADDVAPIIERMDERQGPSWLRLGRCEKPKGLELPEYANRRLLKFGSRPCQLVCVGPIAGYIYSGNFDNNFCVVSELSHGEKSFGSASFFVEEHIRQGSMAQIFAYKGIHAKHFPCGPYGSQKFMRGQAGLTVEKVLEALNG